MTRTTTHDRDDWDNQAPVFQKVNNIIFTEKSLSTGQRNWFPYPVNRTIQLLNNWWGLDGCDDRDSWHERADWDNEDGWDDRDN